MATTSLPSPPFIEIPGIFNFRDIGGYPASSTKTQSVRRNWIFRSAQPGQITPEGKQKLVELGVTTVFDLRSGPELKRMENDHPVVHIEGIERIYVPVFADQDYSPEAIALRFQDYASGSGPHGFTRAYSEILEHGAPAYRRIFEHLRDKPSEGCVIHCTVGKDRTGVIVALTLALAGVEDAIVAEEYAFTTLGLEPLRPIIIARVLEHPALKDNKEGALNMISSKAENMLATLEMLRRKYGGPEGYMRDKCGFSDEDIRLIKRNLIAEIPPTL